MSVNAPLRTTSATRWRSMGCSPQFLGAIELQQLRGWLLSEPLEPNVAHGIPPDPHCDSMAQRWSGLVDRPIVLLALIPELDSPHGGFTRDDPERRAPLPRVLGG